MSIIDHLNKAERERDEALERLRKIELTDDEKQAMSIMFEFRIHLLKRIEAEGRVDTRRQIELLVSAALKLDLP